MTADAGTTDAWGGMPWPDDADDPDDALEADLRFHRDVAEETHRLRVREAARRRLRAADAPHVPEPVTLTALLAEDDEPPAWRIAGLLPEGGRAVLAAQRKAGKTTAVVNLLAALVDGGPFLGRFDVQPVPGSVAVLDFEMSRGQLRGWLRDHPTAGTDRVSLWPMRGRASAFDLLDDDIRRQWAHALRQAGTTALIVDCLRPILDALGLDENREAGRFLVALDALLADAGIGECLLVHHAGHSGERSRGDSRLRDWPDVEWRLVREDAEEAGHEPGPQARRYFAAEGRDVAVPEGLLTFDPATRTLTLAGGSRRQTRTDDLVPVVVELVATATPDGAPGWTSTAIEKALCTGGPGSPTQKDIREARRRAVESGELTIIDGPRRAQWHVLSKASVSVRRSASDAVTHVGGECVSASIEDALHLPLPPGPASEYVADALDAAVAS